MKEALSTIVGYGMLAPFAHIAAAIFLAPMLMWFDSRKSLKERLPSAIALTAVWWAVCLGSLSISQFVQSWPVIGLFIGAGFNVAFVWIRDEHKKLPELGTWTSWLAIYTTPAIGYGLGTVLQHTE